jgi:hypothetical protein
MEPSLEQDDRPAAGNLLSRLIDRIRARLRAFNEQAAMVQEAKELAAKKNSLARNPDFCKG